MWSVPLCVYIYIYIYYVYIYIYIYIYIYSQYHYLLHDILICMRAVTLMPVQPQVQSVDYCYHCY